MENMIAHVLIRSPPHAAQVSTMTQQEVQDMRCSRARRRSASQRQSRLLARWLDGWRWLRSECGWEPYTSQEARGKNQTGTKQHNIAAEACPVRSPPGVQICAPSARWGV